MSRQKQGTNKPEMVNKQTSKEILGLGDYSAPVDSPTGPMDLETELNNSNISSVSCPVFCESKCPNCSQMAFKRSKSTNDLFNEIVLANIVNYLGMNSTHNNMMHSALDLILSKKKVIIFNRSRSRKKYFFNLII